jgi:hypothetical protein
MKKRVIRLTESDVERLVKRIIKEDFTRREDTPADIVFNHIIDMAGPTGQLEEEIMDLIQENDFWLKDRNDRKELARMLVDIIFSTWELPFEESELNKVRKGVARKFESLINYERDMYM